MLNDKVYIVNLHSSTNFTIFLSLMRTIILNNEGVFAIHKATLHETLIVLIETCIFLTSLQLSFPNGLTTFITTMLYNQIPSPSLPYKLYYHEITLFI